MLPEVKEYHVIFVCFSQQLENIVKLIQGDELVLKVMHICTSWHHFTFVGFQNYSLLGVATFIL